MSNRNTGIIATIISILLCGCPGLFLCLFGAITATGQGTFNDANLAPRVGYILVCLSSLLILIPVLVGFFTLRKKPELPQDLPPPS